MNNIILFQLFKEKNMKKILLFLSFVSFSSFAQNNPLEEIQGIAKYNATLLGYAVSCSLNKSDIELVKNQFISVLTNIGLSEKDYNDTYKKFFETYNIAKEKGPKNSQMSCEEFNTEFNKIVSAVKTGRAN